MELTDGGVGKDTRMESRVVGGHVRPFRKQKRIEPDIVPIFFLRSRFGFGRLSILVRAKKTPRKAISTPKVPAFSLPSVA